MKLKLTTITTLAHTKAELGYFENGSRPVMIIEVIQIPEKVSTNTAINLAETTYIAPSEAKKVNFFIPFSKLGKGKIFRAV